MVAGAGQPGAGRAVPRLRLDMFPHSARTIGCFVEARKPTMHWLKAGATGAVVLAAALSASGGEDTDLVAKARLFPSMGAGVTAIRSDGAGRYYVLTERGGVEIFTAKGEHAGHVPADAAPAGAIVYGDDLDVGPDGRCYVADRAANAVKVFSPAGRFERKLEIAAPTSVALLPGGEVAVASLRAAKLVSVFNAEGRVVRQFGEPEELTGREELNRYANAGRLTRDSSGHLIYSFTYLPEPTVRRYDRFGYSDFQLVLSTEEFLPAALAARRVLAGDDPKARVELHVILGAVAVDPASGEYWIGVGGRLLRYGADGADRGSYLIFTPEEQRLVARAVLVEAKRIVVASNELGVFDLPRPEPGTAQ